MGKRTVELGEFERREGRHEMSQLTLEHQGEEIAADRAGAWQAVFWSQHDFGRESEDVPVNWGTYHSRHVFVFGDKSTGYYDVPASLRAREPARACGRFPLASQARLLRDQCAGFAR